MMKTECPRALPFKLAGIALVARMKAFAGITGSGAGCLRNAQALMRPGHATMPNCDCGHYQLYTAAESFCRWNCSQLITSSDLIAAQYAPSTPDGSIPSRAAAS